MCPPTRSPVPPVGAGRRDSRWRRNSYRTAATAPSPRRAGAPCRWRCRRSTGPPPGTPATAAWPSTTTPPGARCPPDPGRRRGPALPVDRTLPLLFRKVPRQVSTDLAGHLPGVWVGQEGAEVVRHLSSDRSGIPGAVHLDDADPVQPSGGDRVRGDQPVAFDPVTLAERRIADPVAQRRRALQRPRLACAEVIG